MKIDFKNEKWVILRPVFNRPEMLQVSLETQQQAKGSGDLKTYFFLDGIEKDNKEAEVIINKFEGQKELVKRNQNFKLWKNLFEAFRYLFQEVQVDYVTVIEDDVVVAKDFFLMTKFCFEKLASPRTYSVMGARELNFGNRKGNAHLILRAPVIRTVAYTLPAYSWRTFSIHANENFYQKPEEYLERIFPRWGVEVWNPQSRIQNRTISDNRFHVLYPQVPRVAHLGVSGFYQGESNFDDLTSQEKLDLLKTSLKDWTVLKPFINKNPECFGPFNQNILKYSWKLNED